jgi:predicted O-methyltransferase YrrM
MIVDPRIEQYIHSLLPARHEVLLEMEERAREQDIPIVGPVAGQLLALLARMTGARRIFELGSAIGYSTLWMALAGGPECEVHYSDSSAHHAAEAQAYFRKAGVEGRVRIHVGDALSALRETPGEFDLIFNDVDKEGYLTVLQEVPPRLRVGGVLVSDNTLWHGRVLEPHDTASETVVEFNRKLFLDNRFLTSLVPLRDGVSISLRLPTR